MQKPKISFKTIQANSTLDVFNNENGEIKFQKKQKNIEDFNNE